MKPPRIITTKNVDPIVKQHIEQLSKVVGGNISFGTDTTNTDLSTNISGFKATGTAPALINTEFAVTHNLNRIPIGFIVFSVDTGDVIYKSTTPWTTTQIF